MTNYSANLSVRKLSGKLLTRNSCLQYWYSKDNVYINAVIRSKTDFSRSSRGNVIVGRPVIMGSFDIMIEVVKLIICTNAFAVLPFRDHKY